MSIPEYLSHQWDIMERAFAHGTGSICLNYLDALQSHTDLYLRCPGRVLDVYVIEWFETERELSRG